MGRLRRYLDWHRETETEAWPPPSKAMAATVGLVLLFLWCATRIPLTGPDDVRGVFVATARCGFCTVLGTAAWYPLARLLPPPRVTYSPTSGTALQSDGSRFYEVVRNGAMVWGAILATVAVGELGKHLFKALPPYLRWWLP